MAGLHIVLVTETPLVHTADLFRMARALEINAQHCAASWGIDPPAIDVIDDRAKLPPKCHPFVFVDDDTDPGTLAVHYSDISARIYVGRASGLNSGSYSVSEAAGHEVCEAIVDPYCDKWVKHQDPVRAADGVEIALEVSDPVQDTYVVDVDGTSWQVANFVTHRWFGLPASDSERFDYRGELTRAGEVGPDGYLICRAPERDGTGWSVWFESRVGPQLGAHKMAATRHPWSRTRKRGVSVT